MKTTNHDNQFAGEIAKSVCTKAETHTENSYAQKSLRPMRSMARSSMVKSRSFKPKRIQILTKRAHKSDLD